MSTSLLLPPPHISSCLDLSCAKVSPFPYNALLSLQIGRLQGRGYNVTKYLTKKTNALIFSKLPKIPIDNNWQMYYIIIFTLGVQLARSLSLWPLESGKLGCHTAPGPHNRWSSSNIPSAPPGGNSNNTGD